MIRKYSRLLTWKLDKSQTCKNDVLKNNFNCVTALLGNMTMYWIVLKEDKIKGETMTWYDVYYAVFFSENCVKPRLPLTCKYLSWKENT